MNLGAAVPSTDFSKVSNANFSSLLLHNWFDLIEDRGAAVIVGLNGLQPLQVLRRESILLCTQTHHLVWNTEGDKHSNWHFDFATKKWTWRSGFLMTTEQLQVCCIWTRYLCFTHTHLFVLGRRRTGVEVVHLVSSAEHRSVISLYWNLQRRVHAPAHPFLAEETERWTILCWLKWNILPAELNWNSGVLMCLTCPGYWGAHCSKSRWPPILQRLDGTRWWPLHHAKCSVHVSPTGQSSMHSSVHTHKQNVQGVVMGVGDKGWRGAVYFKQNAFYSTVT